MFTKTYEQRLEKLGAFEISSSMLKLAKNNEKHNSFLNAGRGNPNWINTQARLAFTRIMEFGVEESRRTTNVGNLAGYTTLRGIGKRFEEFLKPDREVDIFLQSAIIYCKKTFGMDEDALVKELTDAVIGNNYPVPSRCLVNIEKILNAYLESALYNGVKLADQTLVFPTEGGTAAMCYIFDALKHNGLINAGEKIAINTPIFTPYIQIPHLTGYEMIEIDLYSTEESNWHIPAKEIEKLEDPTIKAFFLVNPSNPGSHALNPATLDRIAAIVKKRKDLIIITDDVYGTFVKGFQSVYSVAPYNTLLVYSFSKLYGVTGWRTGLIAMNKNNVFDDLLKKLPDEKLKELDSDYSIVTLEPRKLSFVERICADSRSVGLYHTSGLSTPQQAMMALMSLTHLLCNEDAYIEASNKIVEGRYHDLYSTLGVKEDNDRTNAKYYCLIDIYQIAERVYDKDFSLWMQKNFEEIDFLLRLAAEDGVVLMEGLGFSATPGTLRVSQANLPDDAYRRIAKRVLQLLGEYYDEYVKQ
ncbi:MAG: bifunctional aspartate transaminase/aspartate 4-decarboxylase [Oscillospiraceae bacterium]